MKIVLLFVWCVVFALPAGSSNAFTLDNCNLSCHSALKRVRLSHKPVVAKKCLDCHRQAGNHPLGGKTSMELVEKEPSLCFRCHKPFPQKKTVHSPVKKGTCTACHNPHGAEGKFLIDADNGQTKFCTKCHDAKMFTKKNVHPPVAEGKCTACHDPHQADFKGLLREGMPGLCAECHPDVMRKLKNAPVVHPPVKDGRCTGCHDPHSSSARYLLKGEPGKFCITCHDKIGKKVAAATYPHAPLTKPDSCLACHTGHTSNAKGLLPAVEKDFCLRCHVKIGATLEGKKSLHGPIREGRCTPCHDPHGSPYKNLLKGTYPDQLYIPYDKDKKPYAFCLGCHEKNLLTFPDTTIYTKFRDGKRNLHYVHVSNKRKGRTCRLCHEPHASASDHLVRQVGAPFGEWNIPLQFQATPAGGSCLPGCHGKYSYDRNSKGKSK